MGLLQTPKKIFEHSPDFLSNSMLRNKENWSPGFTYENKDFSQQDHTTMTEWNAQVPIKIAESINACRSELEKMTGKWSNKSYIVIGVNAHNLTPISAATSLCFAAFVSQNRVD